MLPASLSGIHEQTHCMFYRSLFPNSRSFADSSNFGVKGTYRTFSYQFSSQYFIICQLYSYRHLELQDICNALVFMIDKVKITPELWSVIHVLKEFELKNQVLFLLTLSDMKTVVQFIVLPLSI